MNKKDFNFLGYKPEGFIAKKHRIAKTYRFHSAQFFVCDLPVAHKQHRIQFALQLYRLNLQLNAQFLDPPSGAMPKKLRGEKTARFRDAVLFECDLQVAPKKLLDSKTVRFCGKVFEKCSLKGAFHKVLMPSGRSAYRCLLDRPPPAGRGPCPKN